MTHRSPSRARTDRAPSTRRVPGPEELEEWRQLVWFVVNRIRPRLPACVAEEDLFSAGMVGLMAAARAYEPGRGAEFKTYAYHRIRGAILDELRRLDFLPRSQREKARARGTEPPAIVALPMDEDGQENMPCWDGERPCEREDLGTALREQLRHLPERMRLVMTLYYEGGLRMRDIGDRLNLTESRVSQIHTNAVERLRRMLKASAAL